MQNKFVAQWNYVLSICYFVPNLYYLSSEKFENFITEITCENYKIKKVRF